ncbi:hypothetical protein ACR31S_03655 [Streptococcus iniae]
MTKVIELIDASVFVNNGFDEVKTILDKVSRPFMSMTLSPF